MISFKAEALKVGLAPSNVLVLLEWSARLIQLCSKKIEVWDLYGVDVITAQSQLAELLASLRPKEGTRKAALVVTRRALRTLLKEKATRAFRLEKIVLLLSSKSTSGYKNAVMLGIIAGVCASQGTSEKATQQQNGIAPSLRDLLQGLKGHYYTFWVREIIGSRSLVPSHVANAFHDFFAEFTSAEDMEKELVPALEKALLRAPEVVLNDLISPLSNPLPPSLDVSDVLASRLLKPLVSNVKSTNADIRSGALKAFGTLFKRCNKDDALEAVMNEILKPLTAFKVPSPEQRIIYARILDKLPSSTNRARQICAGLSGVVSKESNEAAFSAELSAMATHMVSLASEDISLIDSLLPLFTKGLTDKKASLLRIWALNVGKVLWALKELPDPASFSAVAGKALPKLIDSFGDVIANPVQSVQSGLIIIPYILLSIGDFCSTRGSPNIKTLLGRAKVVEQAVALETKSLCLLNYKAYTKITSEDDFIWLVRALSGCAPLFRPSSSSLAARISWVQVWLYLILTSTVPFEVRRQSLKALSGLCRECPEDILPSLVQGMWTWVQDFYRETKDSPAVISQAAVSRLGHVLYVICMSQKSLSNQDTQTSESLQDCLIDLLVLNRPELLPSVSWIELCLNAGQDPGTLVAKRPKECIEQVISCLDINNASDRPIEQVRIAACNTFAELAFVAPEAILPLLVDMIKADLDLEEFNKYSPQDFAIARTPDGTTFIDILSTRGPKEVLDKGSHEYELLKWEAEVRAQQAAKRGPQKKLTSEEQSKVNAQLAKETDIRKRVQQLERQLQRGIGTIRALALGPPTDAEIWISTSLKAIIDLIQAGVGLLLGTSANDAFMACSNLVTARLGPLRQFIGVATLRALGSSHLPDYLLQESLGG